MKKEELKIKLQELGVNENVYSLNDGLKFDAFNVEENYGMWYVFYYERGDRCEERLFLDESDAYKYLYERFIKELQTQNYSDE